MNNEIENVESVETELIARDYVGETTGQKQVVTIEDRAIAWRNGLILSLYSLADEAKSITIKGNANGEKEGAKEVRSMRLRLRSHRLPIQNEAKAMKDIARGIVKKVGEIEDELIGIISTEEKRLEHEEDVYEAEQAQIKRAREDMEKAITAERFIQMQTLGVIPLDYVLCQTATEAIWEEYVDNWTEQKDRADREKERERIRIEAEAEEMRIIAAQKAKEEKEIADAFKAKEDALKAEKEANLAKERAENAKLREAMARIEAENAAKAKELAGIELATRLKAEAEAKEQQLELAHIEHAKAKAEAERIEQEQIERERPDLEILNDWRIEIKNAINSVKSPTFESESIQEAFNLEYRQLQESIPEIYPF
jgi:hypothetical protein